MNTDYLGLILTDSSETSMTFLEWRTIMNGTEATSNMQLIDGAISRLNTAIGGKADGFSFDPNTGVLQLTSNSRPIAGASVTINLNNYYTKAEVDTLLDELEASFADNTTIQNIQAAAIGDLHWDEDSRALTLYNLNGEQIGTTITIEGGGGGGGGTAHSVRIINGMPSNTFAVASSSETVLSASFYEYYGTESTGVNGTLVVDYRLSTESEWINHSTQTVSQGTPFTVNVTNILATDKTTNIRFTITGGESEISRSLTYNITQVEASISPVNFDGAAVYTGNIDFQYRCVGRNLKKIVHFEIDGETYAEVNVGTSHNTTLTQTFEMLGNYEYGAHQLVVYFETEDGARSNVLQYSLLYNDGTGTDPMIGLTCAKNSVTYGDTININYVLYTPGQEVTDELTIRVYAIEDGEEVNYAVNTLSNIPNNTAYDWNGSIYPSSGTAYVEFRSGNTVSVIEITVSEIQSDYDLEQVKTNLVYQYTSAGRSNNDSGKEIYHYNYTTTNGVHTDIKGKFDGFNWVSNGYIGDGSLTLSGAARHTIQLPMFSTSYVDDDNQTINLESATGATVTTNGRTFEIDFKVSNVTDINAPIIKCMSDEHAGFIVTPQNCYLLASNGTNVVLDSTGFIENEDSVAAAYIKDGTRIRLSFVIEGKGSIQYIDTDGTPVSAQCINIYINGQYANSLPYAETARFNQSEPIVIGSNTCIMNVYEARIYNRGLSASEIMQNYKASPLSVQDRIARFEDNDVLTDDGDVDYYKARNKYNCLLITGALSPYKGADGIRMSGKTESGLILTKPNGEGSYKTEFSLMDKDTFGNWLSSNNVQGTSSVKFPVKNYKIYLAKADGLENGLTKSKKVKYSLKGKDGEGNELSIGESTLCFKGDYMSSDHANTFNANLADTLYQDTTEAQETDSRVQNTVYGFRCLLFQRPDEDSPIRFIADGALNNDKGNNKTFGLECSGDDGNDTTRQKWEFLNNTEALCSFQTDNFNETITTEDGSIKKRVLQGLESTYPDQGDLTKAGLTPNYDYIQSLFTWVCQRANFWNAPTTELASPINYNGSRYNTMRDYKKAIFKNEFAKHFNLNHTLIYYIFMEFVALCDNRAKNMFLQTMDVHAEALVDTNGDDMSINDAIDENTGAVDSTMIDWENSEFAIWMPVLYDLDSCFGVENSGYLQIPYYADWDYHLNGVQKFNGRESVFWLMFEEAFASEIQNKVKEVTNRSVDNGALNYESLYNVHIRDNAMLICPAVVNRDMIVKYESPWIEGFNDYSMPNTVTGEPYTTRHIGSYKYTQRGSRTEQKDAFIYRRSNMLYSKYKCDKFLNNNINFRVGTNGGVVAANSGITITSNQVLYPAVKFGDGSAAVVSALKTPAGTPVTITKPGTTSADKVGFSDTVYIAGGTLLTDIGDISKFRPYELQLQNATGLKKLTIGSHEEGYSNAQLSGLNTSACKLLEEINIENCVALTEPIDLTRNGLITKVYASGCRTSAIMLPNGGILRELHLGRVSDLEVLNHTDLEVFECDSYNNITSLRIENTPNIPTLEIVSQRLPYLTGGLRLVGIDETIEDTTVLEMLLSDTAKGKYIDNNGVLLDDRGLYPYISGTIHCSTIGTNMLSQLSTLYPYLTIDAENVITQYVVSFYNYDNTLLDRQYVLQGAAAIDPITRPNNPIAVPTRPSTVSTIYTFDKWSDGSDTIYDTLPSVITSNTSFYAHYTETTRVYTVRWYNGSTLLQSKTCEYGQGVEYDLETPTDTSRESYLYYRLFNGWDKNTSFVEPDTEQSNIMTVHALFTETMAPTDKTLADMSPTELYALIKNDTLSPSGLNNNIIRSGDTFDLVMGNDYDFDNVESHELISLDDPKTFNGSQCYIPKINGEEIKLFDEDKSFVLAVDFRYTDTTANASLASCYQNNNGFMLRTSSSAGNVRWGASANANISDAANRREMMVIRKRKGDPNLYVYGSNKMALTQKVATLENSLTTHCDAPLSFGANAQDDGYKDYYAKGTVYWAKLWMSDLGDITCKKLAAWSRETLTMQAAGIVGSSPIGTTFRLFNRADNDRYVNCVFLMKDLLDATHVMNPSATNAGGWKDSQMRQWLNARVPNGLPEQWQLLLQKVKVKSTNGSSTTTMTEPPAEDYIFIPSCREVSTAYATSPGYMSESESTITYFTTDASRIKKLDNGAGAANIWWLRSPNTGNSTNFNYVNTTGPVNSTNTANYSYGVCFGFCI